MTQKMFEDTKAVTRTVNWRSDTILAKRKMRKQW